jgi:hypothetical protein
MVRNRMRAYLVFCTQLAGVPRLPPFVSRPDTHSIQACRAYRTPAGVLWPVCHNTGCYDFNHEAFSSVTVQQVQYSIIYHITNTILYPWRHSINDDLESLAEPYNAWGLKHAWHAWHAWHAMLVRDPAAWLGTKIPVCCTNARHHAKGWKKYATAYHIRLINYCTMANRRRFLSNTW